MVSRQDVGDARRGYYNAVMHWISKDSNRQLAHGMCQGHAEWEWSDPEWSGVTPEWKGFDNKSGGTTLASACVLCLNLLLHMWLHISGGRNCCQEIRREVVYRLIGVEMDIEDINDFNLWTKELGCNYWSTYTRSRIGGVPVTSLHCDPIGVDNRSLGVKN